MSLVKKLPEVRGSYREGALLSKSTWFRVGGAAEVLFKPKDVSDLAHFLKNKPADVPMMVLGVGSNLLVRDGGVDGVVIRLGREFAGISIDGNKVIVGAAALDINVAMLAAENNISDLEFLSGIPGTIGGALAMNGGAYGSDIANILLSAEAVNDRGEIVKLKHQDFGFYYRGNSIKEDLIFTAAILQGKAGDKQEILNKIKEIQDARAATQPVRTQTSGSTFKNPNGHKAWELIDKAGCRGLKIGGAQVSELHCNFLINTGDATADDIERLGEEIKKRVFANSGIMLEWEIKIIGKA